VTEQNTKAFTCEACRGTFTCGWTDEEAKAEYRERYGREPELGEGDEQDVLICESCAVIMEMLEQAVMQAKAKATSH
jgi:hypothetical protein